MPKKGLTEIVFLLDRSGSMKKVAQEVRIEFNKYINEQKLQDGIARLTLYLFSHSVERIYEDIPLDSISPLDERNYAPEGGTALFDSIAYSADEVFARHESLPEAERPERVLFVIQTDGEEMDSQKYRNRYDLISAKIQERREKSNWQFIFMGADQDVIGATAKSAAANIAVGASIGYQNSKAGNTQAYTTLSNATRSYRATGNIGNLNP